MPRPRELTDAERDAQWERASAEWDITAGYWYPLEPTSRIDVIAFHADAFHGAVGAAGLRQALASLGVSRVIETREIAELPTRELDLADADFEYEFTEGYWCDTGLGWIVYASHENTLAIGGAGLVDAVKASWPEWRAHECTP